MALDRVRVVLVEPQHPGNVGAVARAMANFGLDQLVLVAPPAWDPHRARWAAPGCDDLIARTQVVETLDEALVGVHHVVAATARHRKQHQPVINPTTFADAVVASDTTWAVLFGREDNGLPTSAIDRAERVLRIPTAAHASLNLAQAALLVCQAVFLAATNGGSTAPGRAVGGRTQATTASLDQARRAVADVVALEALVTHALGLLERVGYTRGTSPEQVAVTLRGALQRAELAPHEVDALRGMVARVDRPRTP